MINLYRYTFKVNTDIPYRFSFVLANSVASLINYLAYALSINAAS